MKNVWFIFVAMVFLSFSTTVYAQNNPPEADAGGVIRIENPTYPLYGSINGTGWDPDGDPIVAFEWALVSIEPPESIDVLGAPGDQLDYVAWSRGELIVDLRVSDGDLWSHWDTAIILIGPQGNTDPVAIAWIYPEEGFSPLAVYFDASESYDPDGDDLMYYWEIGGPEKYSFSGVTFCLVFSTLGQYDVVLEVVDSFGGQNAIYVSDFYVRGPNNLPQASPVATPNSGTQPLTVQFNANASDPDNDPLTYEWDFGDPQSPDNTSPLADPIHIYAQAGTYTVTLNVSDPYDTITETLSIVVAPAINMSIDYARVKFLNKNRAGGKVYVRATFDAALPQDTEVISMTFDGIKLFEVPFMAFKLHDADYFSYVRRGLVVKLYFGKGKLVVKTPKIFLGTVDNSNGVDVIFNIGNKTGMENIKLYELMKRMLIYQKDKK